MPAFEHPITVRFQDCDPAGIVFYPRFFEMMNATVEAWFDKELGLPWQRMHLEEKTGVPLVKTEAEFLAPARLGDRLVMHLAVTRLGRSSVDLAFRLVGPDRRDRLRATQTLAYVATGGGHPKAIALPADLKAKMTAFTD